MNAETRIRVCVLHADAVIAAGLTAVLREQINVDLVEARYAATLNLVGVDVVVADYSHGIAAVSSMRRPRQTKETTATRVLIVTEIDREWEVRSAISAGVRGYVLQGCSIDELVEGVRNVSQGQRYLSHSVSRRIADSMSREELTVREAEVLQLLTTGSCNKSIARELGIAVGTVKVHVKGILEKLGAVSRTHAVIVAGDLGLVSRTVSDAYRTGGARGVSSAGVQDLMAAGAAHSAPRFHA